MLVTTNINIVLFRHKKSGSFKLILFFLVILDRFYLIRKCDLNKSRAYHPG